MINFIGSHKTASDQCIPQFASQLISVVRSRTGINSQPFRRQGTNNSFENSVLDYITGESI